MGKILKYAFRITHIDNMSHIIKHGLVKKDSPNRNDYFVNIGDPQIIQLRKDNDIKGYKIGDYIPFYLGPRSPMLYVIQHGYNGVPRVDAEKIVYCVIKLDDLIKNNIDCIFTDGHALSILTSFYPKDALIQINDIDLKRRKEAELLVNSDLSPLFICGYVVYNEKAKDSLIKLGINDNKIVVSPGYYF